MNEINIVMITKNLTMVKTNIRRRTAAPDFTSKHYYKKKKKHITFTRNPIHQLYLHSILSFRQHQFSNEHQFIDSCINQIRKQSIQHETNNYLTKNTNQPTSLSALLAQPIINFLTKVATPLKNSICCLP